MLENILIIIGCVFILEGALPFLFPQRWRQLMLEITQLKTGQIRAVGLLLLGVGVFILLFSWLL